MQFRRFIAKDVSSALAMVKKDLGHEAIILSNKKKRIKDKITHKLVTVVEIIAAVDRDVIEPRAKNRVKVEEKREAYKYKDEESERELLKKVISELNTLKEHIKFLESRLENPYDIPQKPSDTFYKEKEPLGFSKVFSSLGLKREIVNSLFKGNFSDIQFKKYTEQEAIDLIRRFITSSLKKGPRAEEQKGRCWWAVVGPTGVGKTTTLAKIAARLKYLYGKDGVLVSVDCYKLGAIDQLRRFSSLVDLPLETAKTNKELLRIFSLYKEKDFILVDTTGRNPYSSSHQTELRRLFDSVPGLMAQVMLSATSKREDLMEIIGFYRQFPVSGWTLTKVDETRSLASSLFPIIEAGLPLSYVTNGQRVPEDIKMVSGEDMADMIFKKMDVAKGAGVQNSQHQRVFSC